MDIAVATWISNLVDAIRDLGGEALLDDIYVAFEARSTRKLAKTFRDSIRRTLQDHSATAQYRQRPNAAIMFEPVGPYRSGRWRLLEPYLSDPEEIFAFEVVNEPSEVGTLQAALVASIGSNSVRKRIKIGVPGSPTQTRIAYVSRDRSTWAVLSEADTRCWNAFGFYDRGVTHPVIVEVNPSRTRRKTGGAFVRERSSGTVFLAWRGMMGGTFSGRASEFWSRYDGPEVHVSQKTGVERYAVACAVGFGDPLPPLARFISLVGSAKRDIGESLGKSRRIASGKPRRNLDSLEYDGEAAYRRNGYVRYARRHGRVVNALLRLLRDNGHDATRTVNNDVQVVPAEVLYEVKTEADPTSIYTAVGQLLVNGKIVADRQFRSLVLVIPEQLTYDEDDFASIGIELVMFKYSDDGEPRFSSKLLSMF